MKKIFRVLLLFLAVFVLTGLQVHSADDFTTTTGGTGYRQIDRLSEVDLTYGVLHYKDKGESLKSGLKYAQEVSVLEVPANSEAKIISYANLSNHRWTLTNVTNLAKRFEAENPSWKVLAAVNGDFFDINANGNLPYQTNNPLVANGEFYKTTGSNAIGFKNDGSTTSLVGGKPTKTSTMILAVYDDKDEVVAEYPVQKLNTAPGADETAVFFGVYNESKTYVPQPLDVPGTKFVVQDAELALPNNANDFYGKGVISSNDEITLQRGQFAIVTNELSVLLALKTGLKIRVQYEFTGAFAEATAVTGQNAKFVVDGEYSPHTNTNNNTYARHPRTVAGIKEDGTIVLSVIDGRNALTGKSGMFGDEMAAFMKSLGVKEAYNLDGGGSSYMIVRQDGDFKVVSTPSDGAQRSCGNALLIAIQVPEIKVEIDRTDSGLTFNVDVINEFGFNLDELYVKIGNRTNRVVDNEAKFTGLSPNASYYYDIIYKNKAGELASLMIDGNIKTLKHPPLFEYVNIVEEELLFKVSINYIDKHNAGNLKSGNLYINGSKYLLVNNEVSLLKSNLQGVFKKFDFEYSYNDNAEDHDVYLKDVEYRISNSIVTEALYEVFKVHTSKVLDFYNKNR